MLALKIKKMNQKGIALIQVMILSGLIGIMAVAFVQLTDQQNKSLEISKSFFQIGSFTDLVKVSLSEPQACVATFGNSPYSSSFTVDKIKKTFIEPSTQNKVTVDLATVGDEIAPNVKLTEIRMRSVDIANKKAFAEITFERKGAGTVKREIQFIPFDSGPTGKITNCFTTGTNVEDPEQLCVNMGGEWSAGRCNGIVAVDPNPVLCKAYSIRKLTQDASGRLKIECTPCTVVDKFHHWSCEHYPGKSSFSNFCYYTKVCAGSLNATMRGALWDGKKGPMSAGGGDTSNHSNCVSKRNPCTGEPAGIGEGVPNP